MILDTLDNFRRYYALHPRFRAAFEFLAQEDLLKLAEGKYAIDGDRVFALVSHSRGRGRELSKLETHRQYIDIQFIVSGVEEAGWKNLHKCASPEGDHDEDKDIRFYLDEPDTWLTVVPGQFAVFFPEDAHAPLAGSGNVHKIVVKVAVK